MIRAPKDPDYALVEACLDPEDDRFEQAFEALYERYRDRVYTIAYRMVGTTSDAMDVVQEAFSLLFRKLSTFRFDAKFSTWLFRLVVNCCVDYRRREKSRSFDHLGDGALNTPDGLDGPAARAESSELDDHVHASLQRLSPKLRAVLVLRYLEGLSYDELAESLGVSLGTIKSRLARAHIALEAVLEGSLDTHDYPFASRQAPSEGLGAQCDARSNSLDAASEQGRAARSRSVRQSSLDRGSLDGGSHGPNSDEQEGVA